LQEPDPEADVFKVVLRYGQGSRDQSLCFIYRESRLLERMITFIGSTRNTSWPDDYKEVDGVLVPQLVTSDYGGQFKIELQVESVEHDVDISPDVFDLPDSIQQLVNRQ
jgi:hypothetical protein